MKAIISILIMGLILAFSTTGYADGGNVPYPEGYRNWFHVKTMLIEPGHPLENPFQGIHHVYANPQALKGLNSGIYPDGAVLVFDLLAYSEQDKSIQEGERKLLGVMQKNAHQYESTGGWAFEGFAGNSKTERLVKDGGASCFACHASEKSSDYVFSKTRK